MAEEIKKLKAEIDRLAKQQTFPAAIKSAVGFTVVCFLVDVLFEGLFSIAFRHFFKNYNWWKPLYLFLSWLAFYHFLFKREFRKKQLLKTSELASLKTTLN